MLNEEKTQLTDKAQQVVKDIFRQYQVNNKMGFEQVCDFLQAIMLSRPTKESQSYVQMMKFDTDKDGFLTEENFLKYYMDRVKYQPQYYINKDLKTHHYRLDLKRYDQVGVREVDVKEMPRYILIQDQVFFNLIFELLNKRGPIAMSAWKLLRRLPISPMIYYQILSLESVRASQEAGDQRWAQILDTSSVYKLLYSAHVIEYLMEEQDAEEGAGSCSNGLDQIFESLSKDKIAEMKKNWRSDFISLGGFSHLLSIFNQYNK